MFFRFLDLEQMLPFLFDSKQDAVTNVLDGQANFKLQLYYLV